MKKLLIPLAFITLSGCFGPAKFDSTDQSSIQASTQAIIESLPESDRPEFKKAIMYYSIGGKEGLSSMLGAAFTGADKALTKESLIAANLSSLDGLTGQEILSRYRNQIESNKKVSALKLEAETLLKNKQFQEAIAKYEELGKVDSGSEVSQKGLDKTIKAMTEFEEKLNYMGKVEITEFEATRIDTYLKKDVPAVRLSVKNNGERSLDKVKVMVYFKDADGNVIFEEDYFPVLVNKYSTRDKPLKPGYIQEQGKGKYYTLDSTLSTWKVGSATAKVVDIEFSNNL